MLNRHDRERLAAIESALAKSDPGFVNKINRLNGRASWGLPVVHGMLWGALSAIGVLTLFCLLGGLWLSATVLGTLTVTAAVMLYTGVLMPPWRPSDPPEADRLW